MTIVETPLEVVRLTGDEHRWDFALESAGQGSWEADIANNTVYYSPTWKRIRGYDPEEYVDSSSEVWLARVHPDDRERIQETIRKQNSGEIKRNAFEYRERHKTGHYIWISSNGAPVAWAPDGSPTKLIGTDTDITARKEAEERTRKLAHRLELALEVSQVGVFEGNLQTGELLWDDRIHDIFGIPRERAGLRDTEFDRALYPEDKARVQAALSEAVRKRRTFSERFRIIRPDGEVRTVMSHAAYFQDADGTPKFVGANWDVTADVLLAERLKAANVLAEARNLELEAVKARIEDQSLHDALTGLPNRRYLEQVLERAATKELAGPERGLALLHVDLDRFKQINDTLGHMAGDTVLKHVAYVLLEAAGLSNVVARVGGDEFIVVCLNETDEARLGALAAKIIGELQQPVVYEGRNCRFGGSIGIAIEAGWQIDPRRLLVNADIALSRAKKRGRNRFEFFSKVLQDEIESTKRIADDILRGVEEGEFIPYYQPLVDAGTFEVASVEALVRWSHPTEGLLAPGHFLKIAEDLNVLATIDRQILEQSMRDLDAWDRAGLVVPSVSVNVSLRRLDDDLLIPSLRALQIAPGRIAFEFLESIFLDEFDDKIATNIDAIREMGIDIVVDDFGTGHTSFVSLLKLNPSRFKIDRQLISPITERHDQRRLVASIIEIGKTLGIRVVAEGVENMQQAEILRDLGCDLLQGFAFARPMKAPDLVSWLRAQPCHRMVRKA
ncbi:MAG: EAL domain-containing protein [Devosia sp.]